MVKIFLSLLCVIILANILSCTPAKFVLDVPDNITSNAKKIIVSGVKGKRLPGTSHTIKYEHQFSGTLKDGWVVSSDIYDKTPGGFFSDESNRRNLLLNFGIGINDVNSKRSDKYQFNISDSISSAIVFCKQVYVGKSKEYDIMKKADFSISEKQTSSFIASIFLTNSKKSEEWSLNLNYERETHGGIVSTILKEGMPAEHGFMTNKTDTISINTVFANALSGKNWEQ